jgi:hypothetical protein
MLSFLRKASEKKVAASKEHQRQEDTQTLEKQFKQYQIYLEQVSRLESNTWQTAALLGITSGGGLAFLAVNYKPDSAAAIIPTALFAINASLVWWRFALRWSSIKSVRLEQMSQIEEKYLRPTITVRKRDDDALAYRLCLKEKGSFLQRIWIGIVYSFPTLQKEDAQRRIKTYESYNLEEQYAIKSYEDRGILPACKLLVISNVFVWLGFFFCAVWQVARSSADPNADVAVLALAALAALIIIDILYLRRR